MATPSFRNELRGVIRRSLAPEQELLLTGLVRVPNNSMIGYGEICALRRHGKGGAKLKIMTAMQSSGAMQKMTGDHVSFSYAYSVLFFGAPLPEMPRQKFFMFSSLAAIFEVFSPEQIGCGLGHLYNLKVPDGSAFAGKRCIIKREKVFSKRHKLR